MKITDIIEEVTDKGISMTLERCNDGIVAYFNDGFYKSDGFAYLSEDEEEIILHTRYNEKTPVRSFKDIVNESYDWYDFSNDRFSGWAYPHPSWEEHYKKYGLL